MIKLETGDFVVRKSHNRDIIFTIKDIIGDNYILEGVYVRLEADSKLEDLELVTKEELRDSMDKESEYEKKIIEGVIKKRNFITGKILHIDGDKKYLDKCLNLYKKINCYAMGYYMNEDLFKDKIINLIEEFQPDIIVITGHDSYNKLDIKDLKNYRNTKNFMDTIYEIRKRYSKDEILIMAGACQSNFEALIAAGANFATSPKRVNVHAFDPAIVAIIASYTPFNRIINMDEIVFHSVSEKEGLGGIESYGKMRLLL